MVKRITLHRKERQGESVGAAMRKEECKRRGRKGKEGGRKGGREGGREEKEKEQPEKRAMWGRRERDIKDSGREKR